MILWQRQIKVKIPSAIGKENMVSLKKNLLIMFNNYKEHGHGIHN
jgi:hypothetical protein